ncbi:MAG: hypothetical protein WBV06_20640 [Acidimicrobiia bacterium]
MGRLTRFEEHRYVGTRDDMAVYDCDDDAMLTRLQQRASAEELLRRNLLQAFAPDTAAEAANRGFILA